MYAAKECDEAIALLRILLATLKSHESNWNNLKNGGCGAFFRALRACMNDLKPRLYSAHVEAKELLKSLIQSECQVVDNDLIHDDRVAAYEAAADLLEAMEETLDDRIQKRVEKKFQDVQLERGQREPRGRRNKRETEATEAAARIRALMAKASFDRETFAFRLGILQNQVTDINNTSVKDILALRDGLTLDPTLGES